MTDASRPLILHVIHHLVIGGMENGLVNLINRLPHERFAHAIACVEDYSEFRLRITRPDVAVFALHKSAIGVWALRRELYRLCRRLCPAVLHTRGMSAVDAMVPAWFAGVRHRIHGEHGWNVDDLHGTSRRAHLLRRMHSPFVHRYVTVSRDLKTYLTGRIGIDASRVHQIYNGVDTHRFVPGAHICTELLPPHFSSDDAVVIGTVGRLQAVKDQATLLRAFALLRQRGGEAASRARLLITGDGPLYDQLRELALSLKLGESVHFTGALSDVRPALAALDVYVLTSLNEGISNSILEAMSCGLPVLATAVGGNVELVEDGATGRFFEPGDVGKLAELMSEYLSEPAMRAAHGNAARRAAEDRFSLDVMVERYTRLYDSSCLRAGVEARSRPIAAQWKQ